QEDRGRADVHLRDRWFDVDQDPGADRRESGPAGARAVGRRSEPAAASHREPVQGRRRAADRGVDEREAADGHRLLPWPAAPAGTAGAGAADAYERADAQGDAARDCGQEEAAEEVTQR